MAVLLTLASGCHSRLTQSLRDDSGVNKEQLKQLRYSLCKEVTLAREVTEGAAHVSGMHTLTFRNGRRIDYVVFRSGTLGAVVDAGRNWVDVKFERGPRKLRFIAPSNPAMENDVVRYGSGSSVVVGEPWDLYRLAARGWEYGPMVMPWGLEDTGWHGTVQYGDDEYVAIESSFNTCLELDSNSIETHEKTKRFVPGLDVTEAQQDDEQPAPSPKRKTRPAD